MPSMSSNTNNNVQQPIKDDSAFLYLQTTLGEHHAVNASIIRSVLIDENKSRLSETSSSVFQYFGSSRYNVMMAPLLLPPQQPPPLLPLPLPPSLPP
jgi:hypothetical protein